MTKFFFFCQGRKGLGTRGQVSTVSSRTSWFREETLTRAMYVLPTFAYSSLLGVSLCCADYIKGSERLSITTMHIPFLARLYRFV
jgi:hypothetical protein